MRLQIKRYTTALWRLAAAVTLLMFAQAHAIEDITKEDLVRVLAENGMRIEAVVWLRYPMHTADVTTTLPGLSKVRIKDLDVRPKYNFSKSYKHIVMVVEADGTDHVLEISRHAILYEPQDTVEKFYLEDPAKQVATWGKKALKAISEQKVFPGMTKEQVRASWGPPSRINTSGGRWGEHEQWVFGESMSSYLYFENGRLSSWQN